MNNKTLKNESSILIGYKGPGLIGYEEPEETWKPAQTTDGQIINGVFDQPVSEICQARMIEASKERNTAAMISSVVQAVPLVGTAIRFVNKQR